MVDADAAQAAAQKLADQFAEQGGEPATNGTPEEEVPEAELAEAVGNKRKLETEDDETARKRTTAAQVGLDRRTIHPEIRALALFVSSVSSAGLNR